MSISGFSDVVSNTFSTWRVPAIANRRHSKRVKHISRHFGLEHIGRPVQEELSSVEVAGNMGKRGSENRIGLHEGRFVSY